MRCDTLSQLYGNVRGIDDKLDAIRIILFFHIASTLYKLFLTKKSIDKDYFSCCHQSI